MASEKLGHIVENAGVRLSQRLRDYHGQCIQPVIDILHLRPVLSPQIAAHRLRRLLIRINHFPAVFFASRKFGVLFTRCCDVIVFEHSAIEGSVYALLTVRVHRRRGPITVGKPLKMLAVSFNLLRYLAMLMLIGGILLESDRRRHHEAGVTFEARGHVERVLVDDALLLVESDSLDAVVETEVAGLVRRRLHRLARQFFVQTSSEQKPLWLGILIQKPRQMHLEAESTGVHV